MDKLNFYQQKRRDGGLRTGIDLNDERVLELFEPGDILQDSALLWFVDVRCSGNNFPSEPESIRAWFLERSEVIRAALRQLSEELGAGIDNGWPVKKEISTSDGVRMAVFCSAIRRLNGREISSILSDLELHWQELVGGLASYTHPILANG